MLTIRTTTLLFTLASALALPVLARAAEDAAPTPGASSAEQTVPAPMPEPIAAPIAGMGMGYGPLHPDHCRMHKGAMLGDGAPCKMGAHPGCRMGESEAMTEMRLEMLEKRMDMMQMMMEMMVRQSVGGNQ
jgi:hypothetical protein